jgi:alkylhydroperoxidase family enzyme
VQSVLANVDTAPITEKDRALYSFIRKTVADSLSIKQDDVDRVKAAGWSDEAIYDAITVCALFQFYNTWIDATGVQDLPAIGYEMSGHRLATEGYAAPDPPASR